MAKKVAFEMDDDNIELLNNVIFLTGITKVKLVNDSIRHYLNKFIGDNHLKEEIEELQLLKERKKKKKK